VVNPTDELSFKRIVGLLPGIGPKAAQKLWSAFLGQKSLWKPEVSQAEAPNPGAPVPVLGRALQACSSALPKKAAVSWAQLTATVAQLESPQLRKSPAQMIHLVLEAMYEEYAGAQFENYEARMEDLQQLGQYAQGYSSIENFLADLSLMSNVEAEEEKPAEPAEDDFVRLSTVHQAKGLEFGVVFVVMLCEGLFPSARAGDDEEHLEEERRLFYVAVTRAKNELYLSYPMVRASRGQILERQQPSRFIDEIPNELVDLCPIREQYPIW
jgi:DNA helicase II / ATP-dependent DNA helicase PcrA